MTSESTIKDIENNKTSKELQSQLIKKELQRKMIRIQLNILERERERISRKKEYENLFLEK